jgi:hypothetical protein
MAYVNSTWLRPGDANYDRLRLGYNDAHQTYPALIAPVRSVEDVTAACPSARR